jgi:hypothetical protein
VTAHALSGSLDALIAAARRTDPSLNPANGITIVALSQCGAVAIDTGRPLILLIDAAVETGQLPGRMGTGWALISRLYGNERSVTQLPSGTLTTIATCTCPA